MYIVLEIQVNDGGTAGLLSASFEDRYQAESQYHSVLAAAALSTLPLHTAVLLTDTGDLLMRGSYSHVEPPTPTPPVPGGDEGAEEG